MHTCERVTHPRQDACVALWGERDEPYRYWVAHLACACGQTERLTGWQREDIRGQAVLLGWARDDERMADVCPACSHTPPTGEPQ